MPVNQLEIVDLACERQERVLFRELGFTLVSGQLARVHGHNGSGKTSLLKIIIGLLKPLTGRVLWNHGDIGAQPGEFHRRLTYLGHKPAIKSELTVTENLKIQLGLHGQSFDTATVRKALATLSLDTSADIQAGYLSAGQQRRIALARLWLENSDLWVLDEPYSSLDQHAVGLVNTILKERLKQGVIVILTSHQDLGGTGLHPVDIYLEDAC